MMRAHIRGIPLGAFLVSLGAGLSQAQTPTGTITGIVTDSAGARIVGANITVTARETGQVWGLTTSTEGIYTAGTLLPGQYQMAAEAAGFKRLERAAIVEAGTTTRVDVTLDIGEVSDTVTVRGAVPLLRHDHHQVAGVVKREQIENLPLNGRNFLELAKLEPGVTSPVRAPGSRTLVGSLGAGLQTIPRVGYTRVTVDGGNINTWSDIGTALQMSPEVVEEFQVSTVNFDSATSLTTNGAINAVTRSGGDEYHGSGFFFYRDHKLSAYPGLSRDPRNPDPFFERRQMGYALGGPIRRSRAFFFTSYERNQQHSVVSSQPSSNDFSHLGGIFPSASFGNQFSARVDARLASKHNAFARYTHDGSRAFGGVTLPSGWFRDTAWIDQSIAGVTSVLSSGIANELRFSHFYHRVFAAPMDSQDCRGCFGVGAPRVSVSGAGLTFGTTPAASSFAAHRYQLSDSLAWQRGQHRLRLGFDWEHTSGRSWRDDADRLVIRLWSPERVRQWNQTAPPGAQIPLPASFATMDDILRLSLQGFEITVGPGTFLDRDFRPERILDLYRLYAADTWRAGSRLTLNFGMGWSYEPNGPNYDLAKPLLLAPILGVDRLDAPAAPGANFSPTLGFAWTATRDAKTVIRGGIGHYHEPASSTNVSNRANERFLLSPLGTGRLTVSGSNILWNGRPLDFRQPTPLSGAELLSILPGIRADLFGALNPGNRDFTLRNINRSKEGTNLYDPSYELPSAIHIGLGVQRELAGNFIVSGDFVWRRFVHTFINGIDYNRFNSALGPVLPVCSEAQRNAVDALCSNGPIMFDTTIGRARYRGLLLRVEKRVPGRAQFLGSYALGSYVGSNATGTGTAEASSGRATGFDNDDWFRNYGPMPTDLRHVLNVSGYVALPWQLQAAFSISATSRPPFTAWLEDVDFNGDGTNDDLLPGTTVNAFGRGWDKTDLRRLVERYNQQFAGKGLCCNQTAAPPVTLPDNLAFNDSFFTQDLRITRTVFLGSDRVRLLVFGEVFNLFNTANLVQYSGNLLERTTFGQPRARFTQIFGSGGPRAVQLGARLNF